MHELLRSCEARNFEATPRFLGVDAQGRDVLSYIEVWAPPNLECGAWSYGQLAAAAQLLRRFHDLTAGSALAGDSEVVVHGDPSPVNFIWADGVPVGLIDYDVAAPGSRIDDVAYLCWAFVLAGGDDTGFVGLLGRAKRLRAICAAYALDERGGLLDAIDRRQHQTRGAGARDPGKRDPARVQVVLEWVQGEERVAQPAPRRARVTSVETARPRRAVEGEIVRLQVSTGAPWPSGEARAPWDGRGCPQRHRRAWSAAPLASARMKPDERLDRLEAAVCQLVVYLFQGQDPRTAALPADAGMSAAQQQLSAFFDAIAAERR